MAFCLFLVFFEGKVGEVGVGVFCCGCFISLKIQEDNFVSPNLVSLYISEQMACFA